MANQACGKKIQTFFKKVHDFFKKAFRGVEAFINSNVVPVLHFVQALKAAVDNPATDVITAIIPGKIDDAIIQALRAHLGKAIALLQLTADCNEEDLGKRIECFVAHLRNASPEMRDAIYSKVAALLTHLNAGEHQFTTAQIDTLVQFTFNKMKEEKAL